jgi:chlorobactene glucosyltransferase
MMVFYLSVVLAAIAVMGLIALVNVLTVRSLMPQDHPWDRPLVSVLIPARNEERTIGITLSTLAEQDYGNYEVVILDDNSDDATFAIASQWIARDRRFRIVKGSPLPEGWVGKSFACHQLSREARGQILLFVDADTVHSRFSLSAGVAELQRSGADLLTAIPRQRTESFWEHTLLPLLHFVTFAFLPMPLVRLVRDERLAMANGQYMLWRRAAYLAVGGHEAVKSVMVEDVWLARLVKEKGFHLAIRYGAVAVSCRMYASLAEIWSGFSKNIFPGLGYSIPAVAGLVLFSFATSVLPFFMMIDVAMTGGWTTTAAELVAAQVGLMLLIRFVLAIRFDMEIWSALLHPLAMAVMIGIMVNSTRWVLAGEGSRWKGRVYNSRNQIVTH